MAEYRLERDSMGEVRVPADAMYGAQTQRALDNFSLSGVRFPRVFIRALGIIKAAAAEVNTRAGLIPPDIGSAVGGAADEVSQGRWDDHFPLDVFQTGSGTSTNMNANEVIANRAGLILGDALGKSRVHPLDHVNRGQSSNDVIPSAIHIAASLQTVELLIPSLAGLREVLGRRAAELAAVVKTGRTHLMDALPITFGQEISGWAYQVAQGIERIESSLTRLHKLAVGGTAVGTGANTGADFGRMVCEAISLRTGIPFTETDGHFAAQSAMDAAAELSGQLKIAASSIIKIANDLRLMNSGPYSGFGEIRLPELQPGSSIMPGKVNPVACEATIMACVQVIADDLAVTIGNSRGEFQLNVMLPLICHNLLQSITLLGNAGLLLGEKALQGFEVNTERVSRALGRNPMLITALTPVVGYDKAAEIVKKAAAEARPVRDVASELAGLSAEELDRLLDPVRMTGQKSE